LTEQEWTGVWLSDVPLDENEGAHGDTVLLLKIPKRVTRAARIANRKSSGICLMPERATVKLT